MWLIIILALVFLLLVLNSKYKRLLQFVQGMARKTSFIIPNEIIVDMDRVPNSNHTSLASELEKLGYASVREFSLHGQVSLRYFRRPAEDVDNMIDLLHNGTMATTSKAKAKIDLEGGTYDAGQTNHLVLFPEQRFQYPSNNRYFSKCKPWGDEGKREGEKKSTSGNQQNIPPARATATPCISINRVVFDEATTASLSFQQGSFGAAIRVAVVDSKASFDQFEEFEEPLSPTNLFTEYISDPDTIDGRNFSSPQPHGTFMASLIASTYEGNNPLKISNYPFHDGEYGHLMDLLAAFYSAIESDVRIINLSLGYYADGADAHLRRAFDYAKSKNILVVCSSGNYTTNNDNKPFWPSNFSTYENVLSVAAVETSGSYWVGTPGNGNNVGTLVNLATFGVALNGYVPGPSGNIIQSMTGTSAAAATLSGLAAQKLSENPALSAAELKETMLGLIAGGTIYDAPPIP